MQSASQPALDCYSYFTSLNRIAKLSSNNSFELHISKVTPFSQNYSIPKIKSGPGQSGPRTRYGFMLLTIIKADMQINLS